MDMPKSRGRKPKKVTRACRVSGNPQIASLDSLATARLEESRHRLAGILAGKLPAESMLPMLLLDLWVTLSAQSGSPPNVCVDACQTLRYAYGQFGIRAELVAVDLAVDEQGRATAVCGTPNPSWEGTELDGHCVVWLPQLHRFADPTLAQYPPVARLGVAPLMGTARPTASGEGPSQGFNNEGLPIEGAHFAIRRGDGLLMYTVASREATRVVTENPWIVQHAGEHRRAGINLASYALTALRNPAIIEQARTLPLPRVPALLDAIGDFPDETDVSADWYFLLPGPGGAPERVRLDRIPLPEGAPPALL